MVPGRDEGLPTVLPEEPMLLGRWVRGALVALATGLIGLFAVAIWLKPYDAAGRPLAQATHTQLGLPPCNMVRLFGRPCPTCGMTTSFALLMHGDVIASLRANFAGTLLAVLLLMVIPLGLTAAVRGRWPGGGRAERAVLWGVIAVVALTFIRWVAVVGVPWLGGFG